MITEPNEILRRKTSMVLFEIERSIGSLIADRETPISALDMGLRASISEREKKKGRDIDETSALAFISACYLEDLLQFAAKKAAGTSSEAGIAKIRRLIDNLDIGEVRNACAHPMRPFVPAYWYRVAAIAAEPLFFALDIRSVSEALAAAEQGSISDPPSEWLSRFRWELPNNLPENFEHAATGLIGRRRLHSELLKNLQNPRIPTVALVARGGVGKTALVLDVLKYIASVPSASKFCDRIVFVTLKTARLTSAGIERLDAAATIEEVKLEIANALADQLGRGDVQDFSALLEELAGERVLLCIDNLETLLRDAPTHFTEFNSSLPAPWRVLVTSRVRIDGAFTIPVEDLEKLDAVVLATKYAKSRAVPLPEPVLEQIAALSKRNPLAIKLAIDRIALGHDIVAAVENTDREIAQFSYDNLVEALSEAALRAIEVTFMIESATRADLISILKIDTDAAAEAIAELCNTSLVSRSHEDADEILQLNESVREFLRINPRNLKFRAEIADALKRRREALAQEQANQVARGVHVFALEYVPANLPENLKDLVFATNRFVRAKRRSADAGPLLTRFRRFEYEYAADEIFWRSYARVMQELDKIAAEGMYRRAVELDLSAPQPRVLLAWLYHLQGKHEEAVTLYEELYGEGWSDESKCGSQIAYFVQDGYLKSLLFGGNFSGVLAATSDWNAAKENSELKGAYRIGALRQQVASVETRDANLLDAMSIADTLFAEASVSPTLLSQARKLYKDVVSGFRRGQNVELSRRCLESLAKNLKYLFSSSGRNEISVSDLNRLCDEADEIGIVGAAKLRSAVAAITTFTESSLAVLEKKGYTTVRIDRMPIRNQPDFLFARGADGQEFFVHRNSFFGEINEWNRLEVGRKLMIKFSPNAKSGMYPEATESLIVP